MINNDLNKLSLPKFSQIDPANVRSIISQQLENNKQQLKIILAQEGPFTWDNLMQPLEAMQDDFNKMWSPIAHLHSVMESDALRKAYRETLPIITEYYTSLAHDEKLFAAVSSLAKSEHFQSLSSAQQKVIENEMRDFKLAGVHLPPQQKKEMAALQQKLSTLTTTFSENILDATHAFIYHTTDEKKLDGLPEKSLQLAKEEAKKRDLRGYVITLDYPAYSAVIKYVKDRTVRKILYEAFATRASDQGPHAFKWDNTPIINDILKVRYDIAKLLGFKNYADYALVPRMAKTTDEVMNFLNDLAVKSKPFAQKEYQTIIEFAQQEDHITDFAVWDLFYYSEKMHEKYFHFTQEELRPYFPIQKVLSGLFSILQQLYGITFKEEKKVDLWHPDVQFFLLYDEKNQLRGGLYVDLYARPHKREGAWMDDCHSKRRIDQERMQYPVAFLTCNFMPPVGSQPALLTHDEVLTLFHECGHCLHHLLTQVNHPAVGGINGVPWDAVEFPSQLMENFCFEKETLAQISSHIETGETLPDHLREKIIQAKHFQAALQMIRQLEFSLFDFRLHMEFDPTQTDQVQDILNDVRQKIGVVSVPAYNRFQHSFSHVFAGGYAAGYYSYKWAEVLSCDAYEVFKEHGVLDHATGQSYLKNILEVGGVRNPMESFIAFRGRQPSIDALLRENGIAP
ncbi:MAG: oligopeptidase A [Gammaproteobacteria bacterium RIFCSPHIGHO2_12_FULL_38_14]|nr:MAG: oligopeptidase A [Gammaproteobacteria bacterium RIFCSPHIGHO2_12_FULL_38_14]